MKKKRLFRKLGSHNSPVHSRKYAERVKSSCEQYVRNLNTIHQRAVRCLQDRLDEAENRIRVLTPVASVKYGRPENAVMESVCRDISHDARFMPSIPYFVFYIKASAPDCYNTDFKRYRLQFDYNRNDLPFTRESAEMLTQAFTEIMRFILKGNI